MSRVFQNVTEAALEIRRDLSKGTLVEFSRVQQHVDMNIPGRERQGYEYIIMDGGIPDSPSELVYLGQSLGFKPYIDHPFQMHQWLSAELVDRIFPFENANSYATERFNPLLVGTLEGNWPAYTYRERMAGSLEAVVAALRASSDSRRAYWPIFLPQDALRASSPTRIPCSLGYEVMLRNVDGNTKLQTFYLQRACDFDRFWLSDVWFASQFGKHVARRCDVQAGAVYHYIISLHSFDVSLNEIY